MSYEQLEQHSPDQINPTKKLTKLINRLCHIALASELNDHHYSEAEEIISSLELELKSPIEQLSKLGELADFSSQHPKEPNINEVIDDTAELLLKEIASAKPKELNNLGNLSSIWSSLKAWDIARSEPTAKLCVTLLENFHGSGQAHLAKAYKKALIEKNSSNQQKSFNEALDEVNSAA